MTELLQRPNASGPTRGDAPARKLDAVTLNAVRVFLEIARQHYDVGDAIVFGSRARGDHRPDSDVDLAVVLTGASYDRAVVGRELAGLAFDAMLVSGILVNPLPLWPSDLQDGQRSLPPHLVAQIRRDGVRL